ncbi:TAFII55 protein conserved region-containing protein [Xylariales sp. AK1849]|nr:TAFII55 protein conserved region-containing protein [Xylariales sp. AK1849]
MAPDDAKPALKLETSQASQEMPPPPTTDILSAVTPSTENPRPILKLSIGSRQSSISSDVWTPSGERKTIRIKVNPNSQPTTPAATVPAFTKTKAGRSTKPTEKLIESKKRSYESDDEDQPMATSRNNKIQKIKMAKPSKGQPKTAYTLPTPTRAILVRPKGEPVKHEPGDAYDSEDSDREVDPIRESVMVLRTVPGPSTEYLHRMLEEGKIGVSKANGGADLSIQWIDGKERRAMVSVDGVHYAAVLIDLPTITEVMKTWDRKSMLKNADLTQMLLCFAEVRNETDAKSIALPPMAQKTELKWPHGLTPPMHDAVNRRFRKGMSEKQLVSTANQVKKLLADDKAALESHYEFIHDNEEEDVSGSGEEDAEGEEDDGDYFGQPPMHVNDDDLEAELEAAFDDDDDDDEGATPVTQLEAPTPMTLEATTPAAALGEISDDEEEEEEISEEDEDDDDDEELDEDEKSKQNELHEIKQEMFSFQKQLRLKEEQVQAQTNSIIKNRLLGNIQNLRKEIELRKAKLGITDDE